VSYHEVGFPGRQAQQGTSLPARLAALGPRQREIAEIIYSSTAATPRDIQARLSDRRDVRVVRTLLDRMASKGLVKRRPTGRHGELIYIAAIPTPGVRETAVKKLVEEQFAGSIGEAEAAIRALAKQEADVPQSSTDVRRRFNTRRIG